MDTLSRLNTHILAICAVLIGFASLNLSDRSAHAAPQMTKTTTTKKVSRRTRRIKKSKRQVTRRHSTRSTMRSSTRRSARRSTRSKARRVAHRTSRRVERRNAPSQNFLASRHRRQRTYRRSSTRSYGQSRRTVVRHRSTRPRVTSSHAGFMNQTVLEVGSSMFSPLKGEAISGLHVAVGSRIGPVGGVVETQFTQAENGAELSDLNAQLRIYLPLGRNTEIYPMVAFGQSDLLSDRSASHMDLGIGAQLNLTDHFAIGARYGARIIAEEIDGVPSNGHNLTAQVALRF